MNTTTLKNIHVPQRVTVPTTDMPRLREVTNDPAREFAQRPGMTRPLPNEVAALILARQEFREVTRNGITIDKRQYWSENSITIATKAGTKEKVLITYNRHDASVIHVLTRDGVYVESIPEKGMVVMFDPVATERELGAHRRAQQRDMDRLVEIHGADSLAELARTKSNAAQMHRVVSTFDVPQGTPNFPNTDASVRNHNERPILEKNDAPVRHNGPVDSGKSTAPQFPTAQRIASAEKSAAAAVKHREAVNKIDLVAEQLNRAAQSPKIEVIEDFGS